MLHEFTSLLTRGLSRARRAANRAPKWLTAPARRIPLLRDHWRRFAFTGSGDYWEARYAAGGNSGDGSYGRLARFKAEFLNQFVREHGIQSVLELGCGDGSQLALANYPSYLGIDLSATAVQQCRQRFAADATKEFVVHDPLRTPSLGRSAQLALSLDVVYHLVEDDVFEAYMRCLFGAATEHVVIYASNYDRPGRLPHVRHRAFVSWVEQNVREWKLTQHVPNRYPLGLDDGGETSHADFYVFARKA